MSVTYTATLPARERTVVVLTCLLDAERARRGTRAGRRALSTLEQAVLVLRWFLDGTRMAQLAVDNGISGSTGYLYLHEGIDVLASWAPNLESALLAAKMAGHEHVSIDGTLIETDRCRTPGPTTGVDLWWSGKHANHGGNMQVITAPDGWPLWTSDVRPGREHDTTALRETSGDPSRTGDLGYEGEAGTITVAFKKPKDGQLTDEQKAHNKAHNGNAVRAGIHPSFWPGRSSRALIGSEGQLNMFESGCSNFERVHKELRIDGLNVREAAGQGKWTGFLACTAFQDHDLMLQCQDFGVLVPVAHG